MDRLIFSKTLSYVPLSHLKDGDLATLNRTLKTRERYIANVEQRDPITYLWLTHEGAPLFRYTISCNEYIKRIEAFYLNNESNVAMTYFDMDDYSYDEESRTYESFSGELGYINGYEVGEFVDTFPIITDVDQHGNILGSWRVRYELYTELLKSGEIDSRLPNKIVNPIGIHFDNLKYKELETDNTDEGLDLIEPNLALHLNVLITYGYWNWASRNLFDELAKITTMDIVGRKYAEIQDTIAKQEITIADSVISTSGKVIKLDPEDLVLTTLLKHGYLFQ